MDTSDPLARQDPPPSLTEAEIVTRLDEAEADEAEGRFVDGLALVRDLRRRADALQSKNGHG